MTGRGLAAAALAWTIALAGCRTSDHRQSPAPPRDATPPAATVPIDSTGADGARDVVRRYYAALARRDFPVAYALWARGGTASRQTLEQFAAGFAGTATTGVEFTGPVTIEGAAGSMYATIPVRITAATTTGRTQRFAGTYVLRRANDVPGATPEQLRWHLESADLADVSAR